MPFGWIVGAYRAWQYFERDVEPVCELRAGMKRVGLNPDDEKDIMKYVTEHPGDKWVKKVVNDPRYRK